ncbi:MAG: hypothetical protein KDE51_23510 [Anaerolineales bacterium]|nr:hypothetical protein [Anaerolineales bacterium]
MSKNKRFMQLRIYLFVLGSLLLLTVACGNTPENNLLPEAEATTAPVVATATAPASSETASESQNTGYPAPSDESSLAYPAPENTAAADEGYPPPSEVPIATDGVRFSFASDTKAGDTVVRGTAPPNLSIAILDITLNGVVLGQGVSDADGNFEISVSPLPASRRIGLAFARLEDGLTLSEMGDKYYPYRGDGFMNLPNVGLFMETMLIE